MSLQTNLITGTLVIKSLHMRRLGILIGGYVAHFSNSSTAKEQSPYRSYSVDDMNKYLHSESPRKVFKVSVRQPNEVSKQGDSTVGYEMTAEAIRVSLGQIEDKISDRFLVKNGNELVYMTKTNVKPQFEETLQTLTNQRPNVGKEPLMEWSAEDKKISETSNKPGSQPIS